MPFDMSRLGPLYANIGFDTQPSVIQTRLAAAGEAAANLTMDQYVAVARIALGLPITEAELVPFNNYFAADPTFSPEIGSPELRLLSAGVVVAALEQRADGADDLPVIVGAGVLGGIRSPGVFPGFNDAAEAALFEAQRYDPADFEDLEKPAGFSSKAMASAGQKAGANDMAGVAADLGTAITQLTSHMATQDDKFRERINSMSYELSRLSEQMSMQWWVTNGWSDGAKQPFSKLDPEAVVVRAALELAELSQQQGVAAAPALLDQVIERAKIKKKLSLRSLAEGTPIAWRKTWVPSTLAMPLAALCPVTYAIRLATEAEDQSDWVGRFEREVSVSPGLELSPLDWANQLYREQLATRVLRPVHE